MPSSLASEGPHVPLAANSGGAFDVEVNPSSHVKPKPTTTRLGTDSAYIAVLVIAVLWWAVSAVQSIASGSHLAGAPSYDYLGDTCSAGSRLLYFPMKEGHTGGSVADLMLDHGVCITECPTLRDAISELTLYKFDESLLAKYPNDAPLENPVYPSEPFGDFLCLPENESLGSLVVDKLGLRSLSTKSFLLLEQICTRSTFLILAPIVLVGAALLCSLWASLTNPEIMLPASAFVLGMFIPVVCFLVRIQRVKVDDVSLFSARLVENSVLNVMITALLAGSLLLLASTIIAGVVGNWRRIHLATNTMKIVADTINAMPLIVCVPSLASVLTAVVLIFSISRLVPSITSPVPDHLPMPRVAHPRSLQLVVSHNWSVPHSPQFDDAAEPRFAMDYLNKPVESSPPTFARTPPLDHPHAPLDHPHDRMNYPQVIHRQFDHPRPLTDHRQFDDPQPLADYRQFDHPPPLTNHRQFDDPQPLAEHRQFDDPPPPGNQRPFDDEGLGDYRPLTHDSHRQRHDPIFSHAQAVTPPPFAQSFRQNGISAEDEPPLDHHDATQASNHEDRIVILPDHALVAPPDARASSRSIRVPLRWWSTLRLVSILSSTIFLVEAILAISQFLVAAWPELNGRRDVSHDDIREASTRVFLVHLGSISLIASLNSVLRWLQPFALLKFVPRWTAPIRQKLEAYGWIMTARENAQVLFTAVSGATISECLLDGVSLVTGATNVQTRNEADKAISRLLTFAPASVITALQAMSSTTVGIIALIVGCKSTTFSGNIHSRSFLYDPMVTAVTAGVVSFYVLAAFSQAVLQCTETIVSCYRLERHDKQNNLICTPDQLTMIASEIQTAAVTMALQDGAELGSTDSRITSDVEHHHAAPYLALKPPRFEAHDEPTVTSEGGMIFAEPSGSDEFLTRSPWGEVPKIITPPLPTEEFIAQMRRVVAGSRDDF